MEADFQLQQVMRVFTKIFHSVADAVDHACHDPAAVYFRLGGNLAANDNLARRGEDLHGDAGIGILPEMGVQNGVRHLIAEFVGMTGTDGFRRDQSGVFSFMRMLLLFSVVGDSGRHCLPGHLGCSVVRAD